MIAKVNTFCEHPELIENYEEAFNDVEDWVCHHKRETHDLVTGEPLEVQLSSKDLQNLGLYFWRPPEELIYLRRDDHRRVHQFYKLHLNKDLTDLCKRLKKLYPDDARFWYNSRTGDKALCAIKVSDDWREISLEEFCC
jgi:hypothetical protein